MMLTLWKLVLPVVAGLFLASCALVALVEGVGKLWAVLRRAEWREMFGEEEGT